MASKLRVRRVHATSGTLELSATGSGGDVLISAADDITVSATDGTVVITADHFIFTGLPTSDPVVAGELWNNNGVLSVSAG